LGGLWFLLWRLADVVGVLHHASLWYPPAGLTFALALVLRRAQWPVLAGAVLVGTALARDWTAVLAEPAAQALLIVAQAGAHALPLVLAAVFLRRIAAMRFVTDATPALTMLAVWPLAAAGSAALGVAVVVAAGGVAPGGAVALFLPWFTGDLVGIATTASFFALSLAPVLHRLLGPGAVVRDDDPAPVRPRPATVGLLLVAAFGVVVLIRTPELSQMAGGVAVASYGPMLALLLIARLAPAAQTHTALVVLVGATMIVAEPATSTSGHPQILALALAAVAQLGVALRGLAHLSERDSLTGVANRRAWLAGARRRLQRPGPATVVLVDLDHFKAINDRFGHGVGDDVLHAAATQLHAGAGDDAWFGRIGGEEFAALVPGDADEAERRAERMRRALRRVPAPAGARGLVVRASFGIAPVATALDLATALRAADQALYRAKTGGRDRVAHAGTAVAA
jgi:diguanylate cyclase (GGDEF)-like protein